MHREWKTEILQKLSSTAVLPKGRTVHNMNKILDQEMKGLILDKEKLAKPSSFVCLTHRIFPHVLNSFTPEDLNKSYHTLKLASANTTELPEENSLRRLTRKKAAISKPAPHAQSRSAKKKSGHTSDIYDTKCKLWQWVDVVPRQINKGINKAMEMYFSHPTPLENEPEGVLVHQETVQATCTDVEDSGMSTKGSSCLCKGMAYDGDLSRDKDYFCGNGRQKDCWSNTCIAQGNACIQLTCCCVVVLVVTN